MKDYASMSDFEVNQMVSAYLWGSVCSVDGVVLHGESGGPFDPCNNPEDAWPIITENKISIYAMSETDARGKWGAEAFYPSEAYHFNDNPLRAAMIVFLMMKEGE